MVVISGAAAAVSAAAVWLLLCEASIAASAAAAMDDGSGPLGALLMSGVLLLTGVALVLVMAPGGCSAATSASLQARRWQRDHVSISSAADAYMPVHHQHPWSGRLASAPAQAPLLPASLGWGHLVASLDLCRKQFGMHLLCRTQAAGQGAHR